MDTNALRRRGFLGSACGTIGLLAMAGQSDGVSASEATGRKVPPDLQSAREAILSEIEAHRDIDVPRCDGEFLNLMVAMTAAKRVLEVGTFRGYSGLWLGLGLEQTGGKLVTIDINPDRVREARANFEKAGLADRITVLEGDGHKAAKSVEGPLDLVFLDAEKGSELDYFQTVFPKLRPGGVILLHNVITSKKAMQPYLDMVAKNPELLHVVLSLSMHDGFSVSFRKR